METRPVLHRRLGLVHRARLSSISRPWVKTLGSVSLKRYLPSLPQVSRETIALLAATLLAAWLVAKVPAWQRLVRDGSL